MTEHSIALEDVAGPGGITGRRIRVGYTEYIAQLLQEGVLVRPLSGFGLRPPCDEVSDLHGLESDVTRPLAGGDYRAGGISIGGGVFDLRRGLESRWVSPIGRRGFVRADLLAFATRSYAATTARRAWDGEAQLGAGELVQGTGP